jgi:hypothetical protein
MKEEVAIRLYNINIELRATITGGLTTFNRADIIEDITKDFMMYHAVCRPYRYPHIRYLLDHKNAGTMKNK